MASHVGAGAPVDQGQPGTKSRLGECLVEGGRLSRFELDTALAMQKQHGGSLAEILVSLDIITEPELLDFLSQQLEVPRVDLSTARFDDPAIDAFSEGRARRYLCLPMRFDNEHVDVAMYDPLDLEALEEVAKATGRRVRVQLASRADLLQAIEAQYLVQSHRYAREAQLEKSLLAQLDTGVTAQSKARTIAFVSNKGGVGKTHVAVNLAMALAAEGHETLLIDADLGTANVSAKIGYQPKVTLMHLLREQRAIGDIAVGTEYGFDLIAGQPGEYKLANLPMEHRLRFLEAFLEVSSEYDVAIFDLGAGIEERVLDFALAAHETMVIVTPAEIVAGYSCIKALFYRFMEQEKRMATQMPDYAPKRVFQPRVVVNQADSDEMARKVFAKVRATAQKYLRVKGDLFRIKPGYAGYILYDHKGMREVEMRHEPYLARHPHSKTADCFYHLAGELMKPESLRSTQVEYGPWYQRFANLLRAGR